MAEVNNAFLKSKMNQDLDARILPNGEYRKAINLQISRSEGSTVGEFEEIKGNTKLIDSLDASDKLDIIGKHVDNTNNVLYLFSTDFTSTQSKPRALAANKCFIHRVSLGTASVLPVKLVEGFFLNFDKNFPINGINLIEDLLFFTDNTNQPRKINVALANPTDSTAPTKYTVEEQISVAKYYPYQTIVAMERTRVQINGAQSNSNVIKIQGSSIPSTIRTGDIVTNYDKDFGALPTITDIITVTKLINPSSGVFEIHVSKAFTAPTNSYLDISRPSMTNKNNKYVSNYVGPIITNAVAGGAAGSVIKVLKSSVGNVKLNVGMLVTCEDSSKISTGLGDVPANTGVIQTITDTGTGSLATFDFTLDVANTLTAQNQNQKIIIGNNPDYNSAWKGNPTFLEGEYVRFSYRFKFDDNEYSLMAPFTQIMFIPKQNGYFGKGQNTTEEDMDDAYKSTILAWFENNVDNINLKIPIPAKSDQTAIATPTALYNYFHITDIDILYKESNALSVKVLDTVSTSSNISFSIIKYQDLVHGTRDQYFYDYNYESSKPYKTLPEAQTVRVYDKVPVKALTQEIIGSRIVYGNYADKHTAPESINYITSVQEKSLVYDNESQFPNHSVKQNRTYQIGIVLSDQYGRQSDVILSSQDDVEGVSGSSLFHSYRTQPQIANGETFNWIGDALRVTFQTAIAAQNINLNTGEPGWYSTTNPLGWYSYKVVVKQQEQDYYNVYLPGFVNGYPVVQDIERNVTAFTPLFGDNINKVPRDLSEVGPEQKQFRSSVRLYGRVNNPNMLYRPASDDFNASPYNVQYFPGNFDDTIPNIQTIIDGELATIPFISGQIKGTYNDVVQTGSASLFTREGNGSVPWGTTPGISQSSNQDQAAPFYNLENNPFIAQISIGNLRTNPLGAECSTRGYPLVGSPVGGDLYSMSPVLSISETNPTLSALEIFWETSSTGYLPALNAAINDQYPGIAGTSEESFQFPESLVAGGVIDASWYFLDGAGTQTNVVSAVITSVFSNNGTVNVTDQVPFAITESTVVGQFDWSLKTGPNKTFWYGNASQQNDVYQINITVTSVASGVTYEDTVSIQATLTNVPPPNTATPRFPATATIGAVALDNDRLVQINDTYILWKTTNGVVTQTTSFEAYNGSANATNRPNQVVYSILTQVDNSGAAVDVFEINAIKNGSVVPGLLAVKSGKSMVLNTTYTVVVTAADCNGTGVGFLTRTSSLSFAVGAQHVNQAVCNHFKLNTGSGGSNNFNYSCFGGGEFHFRNSAVNQSEGNLPSYTGIIWGTTFYYNVAYQYNLFAGTSTGNGGLNAGAQMYIIPQINNPTNGACSSDNEVSGTFIIQFKSGSVWGPATTAATVTAGPANTTLGPIAFNSVSAGTTASLTFEFDVPGEYRVLTTPLTGPRCGTPACASDAKFTVDFGDATPGYGNQCNLGPL